MKKRKKENFWINYLLLSFLPIGKKRETKKKRNQAFKKRGKINLNEPLKISNPKKPIFPVVDKT